MKFTSLVAGVAMLGVSISSLNANAQTPDGQPSCFVKIASCNTTDDILKAYDEYVEVKSWTYRITDKEISKNFNARIIEIFKKNIDNAQSIQSLRNIQAEFKKLSKVTYQITDYEVARYLNDKLVKMISSK